MHDYVPFGMGSGPVVMLLIVGLGNPGGQYARHRHNVGFMAVDAIAAAHQFAPFRKKFQGEIADGLLEARGRREKALLLKPATFMNESGRSVGEAMRFHKVPADKVIVFHDELDLAPGKLRAKTGGGNAGHNGLKSISAHIGPDFRRVRIGIGHPGHKDRVSPYVLGDFAKADQEWLAALLDNIGRAAPFLGTGDKDFLNEIGRLTAPVREKTATQRPDRGARRSAQAPINDEARAPAKDEPGTAERSGNPFADALKKLVNRS